LQKACTLIIILTYGDFDNTGNCDYLRKKYGTRIAMHNYDSGVVESGDMFLNRKSGNVLMKKIVNVLFGITSFKPDFTIDEEYHLSEYGLDAKVIYLPGHSKGSIGILTSSGELFCGDLLMNRGKPAINSIIDDPSEAEASIEKLNGISINTVYPGHGRPFLMREYMLINR
jgi:hydroxyacylglutathione hydrolase